MNRQEFEELMEDLSNDIGDYDNANDIIYSKKFPSKKEFVVKNEVIDRSRWSIAMKTIVKIDEFYMAIEWDSPATECQEGQETDCTIYEVEPYEVTVTKYRPKK